MKLIISPLFIIFMINILFAQDLVKIQLDPPQFAKGKPLMMALKERRSTREFSERKLPMRELSDLLWAANGINREEGKHTAPTAMNYQEFDIYVVMEEGIFLYDPFNNQLITIVTGDFRKFTGKQDFVSIAPINLVYVSNLSKISSKGSENDKIQWSNIDVGFISQNVYLYCASENLGTVVRGYLDKDNLAKIMKLKPDQKIILAQTVGYPK
jgi:SagB-type dehydrogenase family enzyme